MRTPALAMLALAALLAAAPATAVGTSSAEAPVLEAPLRPAHPLAALQDLVQEPSLAAAQTAFMAQLEHQGIFPLGHTQRLQAAASAAEGAGSAADGAGSAAAVAAGALPPSFLYHDTYPFCDVNGDDVPDVIRNEYDFRTGRTNIQVLNGENGAFVWSAYRYYWIPYPASYPPYHRDGEPLPERINNPSQLPTFRAHNFAWTPDLNGDGVCDLITYEMTFSLSGTVFVVQIDIEALNGRNGAVLWLQEAVSLIQQFGFGGFIEFTVTDFPTGFHVYEAPDGPRFVWKTSDVQFAMYQDPLGLGLFVYQNSVSDTIQVRSGRTGGILWERELPYGEGDQRVNVTYLAGTADLTGDGEPEVILEQFMLPAADHTRQGVGIPGAVEETEPEYGRAFAMRALRGEAGPQGGQDLWYRMIYDEGVARAQPPQNEDGYETIQWTYAYPLGDTDGDGISEIMAQFLTIESGEMTSANGQFRTHFVPLNGPDGEPLWGTNVKLTGWGFAQRLQTGNTTQLVGIGTIDLPTPAPPGGRFPPKDVRMAALWMQDGTPAWTYHEQFPQDSYVSYHLALRQFQQGLAPVDANADGFLDLLSPSQYVPPRAREQVLLSTATQGFELYDALSGDVLRRNVVYGSNGFAVPCNDGTNVTFIGGHAKRFDATRIDQVSGVEDWRWVFYNDPTPSAATAGTDLNWIGARCHDDGLNRTFLAGNLGIASTQRGFEFRPFYGYIEGPDEELIWFRAPIDREEPLHLLLERLFGTDPLTSAQAMARDATPIVPGVVLGTALGVVSKKRGWTFRRRGDGLPDLYGRGS